MQDYVEYEIKNTSHITGLVLNKLKNKDLKFLTIPFCNRFISVLSEGLVESDRDVLCCIEDQSRGCDYEISKVLNSLEAIYGVDLAENGETFTVNEEKLADYAESFCYSKRINFAAENLSNQLDSMIDSFSLSDSDIRVQ